MKIQIRRYRNSDFEELVRCVEELQDFIVNIDSLKRCLRLPAYGKKYVSLLIKKVHRSSGIILLAEYKQEVIGCVVGIIEKQTKDNLLECVPTKAGRILELFVSPNYRSRGIGKLLINKLEHYFNKSKCDVVRVKVFQPNKIAHNFYYKLNYHDRVIDMIKQA